MHVWNSLERSVIQCSGTRPTPFHLKHEEEVLKLGPPSTGVGSVSILSQHRLYRFVELRRDVSRVALTTDA